MDVLKDVIAIMFFGFGIFVAASYKHTKTILPIAVGGCMSLLGIVLFVYSF